jgi:Fe-S-cluster containining protein
MSKTTLLVVNGATATFDCSFGRGCPGICCQHGEPSVTPAEYARIRESLPKVIPHLRPEAAKSLEAQDFTGADVKLGNPMVRVVDGWCLFFNEGCVLHKVGALEGDFSKYKPIQCTMFPLEPNGDGSWYVRQWHLEGEEWNDLFCLNPANTPLKAVDTLAPEIAVAEALGPDFAWE